MPPSQENRVEAPCAPTRLPGHLAEARGVVSWRPQHSLSAGDQAIARQQLATDASVPSPQAIDSQLWLEVVSFLRPRERDGEREARERAEHGSDARLRRRWRIKGVPELRGARFGAKAISLMLALAYYSSLPGEGVYVGNRRLAEHAGCHIRYARLLRTLLRSCGLLIRTTHGAGAGGARDLLAFPGGARAATAFITRRTRELDARADQARAHRARPTGSITISDQARRVLDENPRLLQRIADDLGGPDDQYGALRVLTVVLDRAGSSGKAVKRPAGYMRVVLRRERAYFRSLMSDPAYREPDEAPRATAVSTRIAALAANLAPPG